VFFWATNSIHGGKSDSATNSRLSKYDILALWQKSDWAEVIASCDTALRASPLDPFYLGLKGMASFYEAMELPEGENRGVLIDDSIMSLRRALTIRDAILGGQIPKAELEYVLAKAYFHKGAGSMDLTVSYLDFALKQGFIAPDIHEYLAMALASLGETDGSLAEFEKAMAANSSTLLKIAAAQEYLKVSRRSEAEKLLLAAVQASADAIAKEKARLLLADDFLSQSRWDEAEVQVNALLGDDPDSAEGHYRLGLLFQVRGDPVHARAEWRKAVTLDPMHAAARQKLAERL
jgi:tetratricopeptide (TPR) repeat protein